MAGVPLPKGSPDPVLFWSTATLLPEGFAPMLASPAPGPLDSPDCAYEVKWEGLRLLGGRQGREVVARAGGQDVNPWFPELASLRAAAEPDWILLDGELVVLNEESQPSQALLQERLRAPDTRTVERIARKYPATLVVSDVLRIGDSWLLDVPWEERRDILERAVRSHECVEFAPYWSTGEQSVARARELALEAVLAKRRRGKYAPGERTRDWLQIRLGELLDAVVCGWNETKSGLSLFVGLCGHSGWLPVGQAAVPPARMAEVREAVRAVASPACPFGEHGEAAEETHWTRPELTVRVRHQGWTGSGRLRSPAFVEWSDSPAAECVAPDRAARPLSRSAAGG